MVYHRRFLMNPDKNKSDFEPIYLYIEEDIYYPVQKELEEDKEDVERGLTVIDIF